MQILHCNDAAFKAGEEAFNRYLTAVVCGPRADNYAEGMSRETGVGIVVGAITAAIRHGFSTESQIVQAVARASRCRSSTVRSILTALTGTDETKHVWGVANGHYYEMSEVAPRPRDCDRPLIRN